MIRRTDGPGGHERPKTARPESFRPSTLIGDAYDGTWTVDGRMEEDIMGKASLGQLAAMHPELIGVEFDFTPHEYAEGTIEGWALDDGRIHGAPDGWHVYSVVETDGPGFDPVTITHAGAHVNHRFDFATTADLDAIIDGNLLGETDDWGFTRTPITQAADGNTTEAKA